MRPSSPVEIAAVVSVAAIVLASSLPTFLRNLHGSRFVEATDGLNQIAGGAVAYSQGKELAAAFPPSVPLTPAEVPHGVAVTDPPGTWDQPTWKALGFSLDRPHRFAFEFQSDADPTRTWFVARAHGDLNGDGITSTFELGGEARPGQPATISPQLYVHREIE